MRLQVKKAPGIVEMKKNHWGPITIAIAVDEVFLPKYDETDAPALDDVYFKVNTTKITIPQYGKTTQKAIEKVGNSLWDY